VIINIAKLKDINYYMFTIEQNTYCFRIPKTCCIESKSPDNDLFKYLAHVYADNHSEMHGGNACPPEIFPNGVTNGAYW